MHKFTHQRRCQPRRVTASSSGAVRVRRLAQGHIDTPPGGAGDRTSNPPVPSQPALPPEPHAAPAVEDGRGSPPLRTLNGGLGNLCCCSSEPPAPAGGLVLSPLRGLAGLAGSRREALAQRSALWNGVPDQRPHPPPRTLVPFITQSAFLL